MKLIKKDLGSLIPPEKKYILEQTKHTIEEILKMKIRRNPKTKVKGLSIRLQSIISFNSITFYLISFL